MSGSGVKLNPSLPDEQANGLPAVYQRLVAGDGAIVAVIALLDTRKLTTDLDDGSIVVTARIRRIEPIPEGDVEHAIRVLERAYEARTGHVVLPLEVEDDVRAVLKGVVGAVDPDTGELPPEGRK